MAIRYTPAVVPLDSSDQTAANAAQDNVIGTKAPLNNPAFVGTVTGITKAMVGLGNVDNTTDLTKPVSTAQATADATKVAKGELVINVRDYGAKGDGTTDDTAAINAAAVAAVAAGAQLFASGTFLITNTVIFTGNVNASGATFNWAGPANTVAVQVGTNTSGTLMSHKTVFLPTVLNTNKTGLGWAQTNTLGSVGVRCINLNSTQVTSTWIQGFATGMHLTGIGTGCCYATINVGHLDNNKVQQLLDADATGWCNQNTFVGGKMTYNSGEGNSITGTRFIMIPLTASQVNNNTWLNASMEGEGPEFFLDCSGCYNHWISCRWECTSGGRVRWGASSTRNVILWGYATHNIVETFDAASSTGNSITSMSFSRLRGSAGWSGVLELENSTSTAAPADVVMAAGAAKAGSDPTTAYTVARAADNTKMKRSTDAFDRMQLDHVNGAITFGAGTVAPTKTIKQVGSVLAVDGAALCSGTDGANDIGIISSYRFRSLFLTGGLSTGVRTVSGSVSIGSTDSTLLANSASACTLTLPTAVTFINRQYTVRNIGAGTVSVASFSGTVDGSATATLLTGTKATFQSDGTNWWTTGGLDATKVSKGDLLINVKDYGAKGDGITDDTAAINSALAGNPGKIIFVPAGVYMINATATVTTSPGSQPAGILMNQAATTLRLASGAELQAITNASDRYSIVQVSAADCVIEGGTITGDVATHTGASTGQWGYCIELTTGSHRAQVSGTRVQKAQADGIFVVGNPSDIRIVDVIADSNRRQGLSLTDATRPLVLGGHFMNTATLGTPQNPSAGIDIEPDPSTGRNVVDAMIIGANFTGNIGPGLLIVGALAQVTTVTVIGCRATNNVCSNNTAGFQVSGGNGEVVAHLTGCTAVGNTMYGFRVIPDGVTLVGCVARANLQYGFHLGAPTMLADCSAELNGLHGFSFQSSASNSRLSGGSTRANSQQAHQAAANIEVLCTMTIVGHISEAGTQANKPAYAFLIRAGSAVRILASDAFGAFSSLILDSAGTTIVSPALGLPVGVPTAVAAAFNGTSPPAPVVATTARNNRGSITFGSGTATDVGAQCTVSFTSAYSTLPYVVAVPRNAATAALGLYISTTAVGSFTVSAAVAPAASQANTTYSFDFIVVG